MKRMFDNFSGAMSDYVVGTMIALVLTALARREDRYRIEDV